MQRIKAGRGLLPVVHRARGHRPGMEIRRGEYTICCFRWIFLALFFFAFFFLGVFPLLPTVLDEVVHFLKKINSRAIYI